jgi:hypothetical protein
MKKIPTLFERVYENHKVIDILPNITNGMEWVLNGDGIATIKYDGSCCAVIDGEFYKRYDAKKGKPIPDGAIKCQDEPDKVTGHLPCWVKVDENNPADKWFKEAYYNTVMCDDNQDFTLHDGTYEAIGKHFQGNPYNLEEELLVCHGNHVIFVERTFEGIKKYLHDNYIEGIVFWKDGEPKCKIKRTDFGFEWNGKR